MTAHLLIEGCFRRGWLSEIIKKRRHSLSRAPVNLRQLPTYGTYGTFQICPVRM